MCFFLEGIFKCHFETNLTALVCMKCLRMCVLPGQNGFLSLWKDAFYWSFPQKHPSELWNVSQVGYTLVFAASASVLLLFALHFLVFLLSASLLFFLVSLAFFPPCLPSGTKESIATGHTGGMEAVLLFRPWCLLCKIGGGGCYWSTVCVCMWGVGEVGWGYCTKAYLVLFKMVLQWDVQIKQNACKTWTLLIDWTARHHKAKD